MIKMGNYDRVINYKNKQIIIMINMLSIQLIFAINIFQ
jgi:hypothetical protein